jgi:hypothetical protein
VKKISLIAVFLALLCSRNGIAQILPCNELMQKLRVSYASNGLKLVDYKIELVDNEPELARSLLPNQVIDGSCNGGTKRVIYTRFVGPSRGMIATGPRDIIEVSKAVTTTSKRYIKLIEQQIGRATVGLDDKDQWTQEAYYISVVLKNASQTNLDLARRCANLQKPRFYALANRLLEPNVIVRPVAVIPYTFDMNNRLAPTKKDDALSSPTLVRISATEAVFESYLDLKAERQNECTTGANRPQFILAISKRYCGSSIVACKSNTPVFANAPDERVFRDVSEWIASKLHREDGLPVNSIVFLVVKNDDVIVEAATTELADEGYFSNRVYESSPKRGDQLRFFQKAVLRLRSEPSLKTKVRLSSAIGSSLALADNTVLRVIDVIDNPSRAIENAISTRDIAANFGNELGTLSDEFARGRIRECVRYRGISQLNISAIQACSGLKIVSADDVTKCLTLQFCRPDYVKTGWAQVGLISATSLKTQAGLSLLPRGTFNVTTAIEKMNSCKGSSRACSELAALAAGMSADSFQKTETCLQSKQTMSECLLESNSATAELNQLRKGCEKTKGTDVARCMMETKFRESMPKEIVDIETCLRKYPLTSQKILMQSCVVGKIPALGKEFTAFADCSTRFPSTSQRLEFISCLSLPSLPPEQRANAEAAVSCYAGSSGDGYKLAGCFLAKRVKVGGDLGMAAQCYLEGGANALGMVACLAGDKINAELKIAIQCAQTTSEAITFGVCVAGQLTVKELVQCQGKRFAQGNCFGENNEFRRLARSLLGTDIGEKSVIADVMNVQLDVVAFQVKAIETAITFADNAGREIQKGTEDVGRELDIGRRNVEREYNKGINDLNRNLIDMAQLAGKTADDVISEVKKIKELIPKPPPPIEVGKVGGHRVCIPWC